MLCCVCCAADQSEIPEAPPLPDNDGTYAALVLLQRLLRGRAVQNEMYAGMMAQQNLIRELRLELEATAGGLHLYAGSPCLQQVRLSAGPGMLVSHPVGVMP
jgi:hypothetical protein